MEGSIALNRTTSYNRAYLATVLRTSAQIPLRWTSDTLEALSEMLCIRKTKRMGRENLKTEKVFNMTMGKIVTNSHEVVTTEQKMKEA